MKKLIVLSSPDGKKRCENFVNKIIASIKLEDKGGDYVSDINELKHTLSMLKNTDILIAVIGTGGTRKIASIIPTFCDKIKIPVVFVSYPENNSLAAMLDILWDFRQVKYPCLGVLWGQEDVNDALLVCDAYVNLRKGLVMMHSNENKTVVIELAKKLFSIPIYEIPVSALVATFYRNENSDTQVVPVFVSDKTTRKNIAKIYHSIIEILQEHNASAISIDCFEFAKYVKHTPCIAFSLLNAAGYTAACEADILSTILMSIVRTLSGTSGFVANVGNVLPDRNKVLLTHCTISRDLVRNIEPMPHFETGLPLALKGEFNGDLVTITRFAPDFSKLRVLKGSVAQGEWSPNMCRTQIWVDVPKCKIILDSPLGNHYVVAKGDISNKLVAFSKLLNIPVETNF
ncbi:MAG: hypothetical protein QXL15_02510 [Candidatus Korarchaeota archaeon]